MKIHTVWGMRKSYPHTPELMVAWDEYSEDGNPEGFAEDVERAISSWGDDLLAHRFIVFHANEREILRKFEVGEIDVKME